MLNFTRDGHCFNFRSAAVIIEQGHVLIHQGINDDFWTLPGGRVEFLESAQETVTRELMEELGIVSEVIRPLWLVENFFVDGELKYHELGHYFLTQLKPDIPFDINDNLVCIERGGRLRFRWCKLSEIAKVNLYPTFLKQGLLDLPQTPEYFTWNDIDK
ncbi:NUDIX hydrolase [Motilimonas sp. KMU-193]|uniref:NUDIX hydrolase n=1 Tax=Motilimonas sp. KMU-193 TaxID=3388668 RepID=UPI00396B20F6